MLDGETENAPGCIRVYRPPFEEFEMRVMEADEGSGGGSLEVPASEGPSILLVLRGQGSARASHIAIKSKDLTEEVQMAKGVWVCGCSVGHGAVFAGVCSDSSS